MGMGGVGNSPQPIIPKTPGANGAGAPAEATPAGTPTAASPAGDSSQVGGTGESSGMELFQAADVSKDVAPVMRPPEQIREEFASDIRPTDPPKDLEPSNPPKDLTPTPPRTEPTQTQRPPEQVQYTEPQPAPPLEQVIEVAGSGMGADKKFKMYPSELAAVYAVIKGDGDGMVSLEDMQKQLKTYYGIDTEIKNGTLVNTENGHALISDTNGNGTLDMNDMNFGDALKAAGIDPASIPKPGDMMAMMSNVAHWSNYWRDQLDKNVKEMNRPADAGPAPTNPTTNARPTAPANQTTNTAQTSTIGTGNDWEDKLVTAEGGDRKYTMYLSELASMYGVLKGQDKPVSLEQLQTLMRGVGIEADIKDVDGQQTLVNPRSGHMLISDTDGTGKIDPKDLNFEKVLRDNGVDPERIAPRTASASA